MLMFYQPITRTCFPGIFRQQRHSPRQLNRLVSILTPMSLFIATRTVLVTSLLAEDGGHLGYDGTVIILDFPALVIVT